MTVTLAPTSLRRVLRWAACSSTLLLACASKETASSVLCDDQGITLSGAGPLPTVGWMKLADINVNGVAVDAEGNVFVAGDFFLTEYITDGHIEGEPIGGYDAFLASYTPRGEVRWAKRFGSAEYDGFRGLGLDSDGNIYTMGSFGTGADLGAGPIPRSEKLVIGFSNDGALRWATEFFIARPRDLVTAPDGTLYMTGDFEGGAVFTGATNIVSAGGADAFLASYDRDGTYRWSTAIGGAGDDAGVALATNGSGVTVAGNFSETAAIGGSSFTSAGDTDIFVASFDESGAPRWTQTSGGTAADSAGGVAVDDAGVTYLSGTIDSGPVARNRSFVSSFDGTGAEGAKVEPSGSHLAVAKAIAVTTEGDVVATGHFAGSADFGGGPVEANSVSLWLASYGADLRHRWSVALSPAGATTPEQRVASGPQNAVYAVGAFNIMRQTAGVSEDQYASLVQLREDCW